MTPREFVPIAVLAALTLTAGHAQAGDIAVSVTGGDGPGATSCLLFSRAAAFPFGQADARLAVAAPEGGDEICRFRGVAPGAYAVAVARLPVGAKAPARDLLGRPKDPWGVSNNVRPVLRPPTFDEARFEVPAGGELRLDVRISR